MARGNQVKEGLLTDVGVNILWKQVPVDKEKGSTLNLHPPTDFPYRAEPRGQH